METVFWFWCILTEGGSSILCNPMSLNESERFSFFYHTGLGLSNKLISSLTGSTSYTVLLSSFFTSKIINILPVINSHPAQCLPVEFSHLLHRTFYPNKNGSTGNCVRGK